MSTSYPLDKIKVLLLENLHPRAAELLGEEGYSVESHAHAPETTELVKLAREAHILGIRSKTTLTREFFDRVAGSNGASKLWAVGCFCIGTNQVDLAAAADHGIAVFNAPFANTRSVAELTISEIIALHRRMCDRSMQMHSGGWNKSAEGAHEVRGRTLGIVGYGRIGSQVSVLAEALGMNVLLYDIAPCLPLGNARRVASLNLLLESSDVVTLHVPSSPATTTLVGKNEIARMKPGSFLINNARGSVVDVDALADALRSGKLAGAALDVFPTEPGSGAEKFDSPLQGLPNVILTPHIGGSTVEAQRAIAEEVAVKLAKYMNNGSTTTSVNVPEVELPKLHADHHRILHYHRNVPGVLSQIHKIIADLNINIAAEYLQSNPRHGYVIMDVSAPHSEALKDRLKAIPETIRVRALW